MTGRDKKPVNVFLSSIGQEEMTRHLRYVRVAYVQWYQSLHEKNRGGQEEMTGKEYIYHHLISLPT